MKEITKTKINVHHIISEPGDATRYDYYVYINYTEFTFMPCKSSFSFPQHLDYYNVQNLSEEDIVKLATEKGCNPWTLKECIRTINELYIE